MDGSIGLVGRRGAGRWSVVGNPSVDAGAKRNQGLAEKRREKQLQ